MHLNTHGACGFPPLREQPEGLRISMTYIHIVYTYIYYIQCSSASKVPKCRQHVSNKVSRVSNNSLSFGLENISSLVFFFFFFCNFTSISEFILPCCYPAGFAAASIDTAVLAIDKQQQHNNANNIDGNGVFGRLLQLTENKWKTANALYFPHYLFEPSENSIASEMTLLGLKFPLNKNYLQLINFVY